MVGNGIDNDGFNVNVTAGTEYTPGKGKERSGRRPLNVQCDIHPWMKAYLFSFDHPYYAVTKEDGSSRFRMSPPGEIRVMAWQEGIGYVMTNKGEAKT